MGILLYFRREEAKIEKAEIKEIISKLVNNYKKIVIGYRRDIHMYPELGHKEIRTSKKIENILSDLGYEVTTNVGKTGVVGLLRGNKPGKTIAIRADMDALPIKENTDLEFKSINKGIMHACGHDVHTAILLGVAHILMDLKSEIKGNIKLVFQPSEETSPNGGAKGMIEDGVLKNPKVDMMLGLHVWPDIETGKVGIKFGSMSAGSDRIRIVVKGKNAHASTPEYGVDAGIIAAEILLALQTIVSRNISSLDSCVISIGIINGGNAYNVVPDEIVLDGTVRTLDEQIRKMLPSKIETIISGITRAMGGSYEFNYYYGYPSVMNDKKVTKRVMNTINKSIGKENLHEIEKTNLSGEDFGFFAKEVPSTFFYVGCCPADTPKDKRFPLHNPNLVIDENAITVGLIVMINAVFDLMNLK